MPSDYDHAVSASVSTKFGIMPDVVNDFGMDRTGGTDCGALLQKALNSVAAATRSPYLKIPSGCTILIDSSVTTLVWPSGVILVGDGPTSILQFKNSPASGVERIQIPANCSGGIRDLTIDGGNTSPVVVESSTMSTDPSNPVYTTGTTIRLRGASNFHLQNVVFTHTLGYSVFVDATAGNVKDIDIVGCDFFDIRAQVFGTSGTATGGGWAGGIHYRNDGLSYTVDGLTVRDCRFYRISGHCFWGSTANVTSGTAGALNTNIKFNHNRAKDHALDMCEMAIVEGFQVIGNKSRRGGYYSNTDGAIGVPFWGQQTAANPAGTTPVVLDHTRTCIGGVIQGNDIQCFNGTAIDGDGLGSSVVDSNNCVSSFASTDPNALTGACGPPNAVGANYSVGFNLGNTNNDPLSAWHVTVSNNYFAGCGGGGVRMYTGRFCQVHGNLIDHPANASSQPITFGPTSSAAYQRCYGNSIHNNVCRWNPSGGGFMVLESPYGGAVLNSTDVNYVYNNVAIADTTNNVVPFYKDPNSGSTTGPLRANSVTTQASGNGDGYTGYPIGTVYQTEGTNLASHKVREYRYPDGKLIRTSSLTTTDIPSLTISGNGAIDNVRNFTGNSLTIQNMSSSPVTQTLVIDSAANVVARSVTSTNGPVIIEQKNFGGYAGLLIEGGPYNATPQNENWPTIGFSLANSNNADAQVAMIGMQPINATAGSEAGDLAFWTKTGGGALVEQMRITAGGNVGIGTSQPVNKLDITNGAIHIASFVPTSTSMALYNNAGTLYWNGAPLAGATISGTTNYIPVFTAANALGNSIIQQSGSNFIQVGGAVNISDSTGANSGQLLTVVNTTTTGSNFAASLTCSGAGATTNTGLYVTATGAATNYGIRVTGPHGGSAPNNWCLSIEGSSPNYFAGAVGIGTTVPRGMVDILNPAASATAVGPDGLISGWNGATYPTSPYSVALTLKGTTSDLRISLGDGTGRCTLRYNNYVDAGGEKYLVTNELAHKFRLHLGPNGQSDFGFYAAPNTGAAGSVIAWTQLAELELNNNIWFSPRGNSTDFIVTKNGFIGIGTASPANLLDLTGGGIHLASFVPPSTSMALYNNSGTLMWNGLALATGGGSISGTANYIPLYTGPSTLGNSIIQQSGSNFIQVGGAGRFADSTGANSGQCLYANQATATGTNYALSAHATGSGATTNYGMYVEASGATTNYGIRIVNPPAGPNNYALYVDASAQSYFAGNVGLGVIPNCMLEVNGLVAVDQKNFGGNAGLVIRGNSTNWPGIGWSTVNSSGVDALVSVIYVQPTNSTAGQEAADMVFVTYSASSATERVRIKAAGAVGIGAADPSLGGRTGAQLTIISGASALCTAYSSSQPCFTLNNLSNGAWVMYDYSAGSWVAGLSQKAGNVGIGTSSPANSLDLATGGGIHITAGTPGSTAMALYNVGGVLYWNGSPVAGSTISGTANYIPVFTNTNSIGNSVIYHSASNIGIGTTTPGATLDVAGGNYSIFRGLAAGNDGGISLIAYGNAQGSSDFVLAQQSSNNVYILNRANGSVYLGTNNATAVTILPSAYVGIATLSPNCALEVNGLVAVDQKNFGGNAGLVIRGNSTNWPGIGWSTVNSSGVDALVSVIYVQPTNSTAGQEAGDMVFVTYSSAQATERVRIKAAGPVGVGTADPSLGGRTGAQLTVLSGSSAISTAYSGSQPCFLLNNLSNGAWVMYDFAAGNWQMGLSQQSGNVGIGNPSPAYKLDVSGTGHITGNFIAGGLVNAVSGYQVNGTSAIDSGRNGNFIGLYVAGQSTLVSGAIARAGIQATGYNIGDANGNNTASGQTAYFYVPNGFYANATSGTLFHFMYFTGGVMTQWTQ